MNAAFQHLRALICHTLLNTMPAYLDGIKPVIIQTDACKIGIGATLTQSGWPIAFASKTLTNVETCYTYIERECLSVCFSLKKFHTYLYGRHIIIQNDHKLLEMIQHKPIHPTPPHLQCMLLHMQRDNYMIQYKPDKEMILTDCLSCFPSCKESLPIAINQNIQHV